VRVYYPSQMETARPGGATLIVYKLVSAYLSIDCAESQGRFGFVHCRVQAPQGRI